MLPHMINAAQGPSGRSEHEDEDEDADDSGTSSGEESACSITEHSPYEVFELDLQSSVYDEALLCPLVAWHFDQEGENGSRYRHFRRSAYHAWSSLLLNYLLQGFVVGIMVAKTWQDNADEIAGIFGSKESAMSGNNMCWILDDETRKFLQFQDIRDNFHQGQTAYYTCLPDEVLLASRFSQLDLNADGKWTYSEAQLLTIRYQASVGRWVDMAKVYCRIVVAIWDALQSKKQLTRRYSKEGQLAALLGPAFAQWAKSNGNLGLEHCNASVMHLAQIPSWYFTEAIQPFMGICGLLDKDLCSNMVLRGSWARDVADPAANATNLTRALRVAMGFTGDQPIFEVTNELLRALNPCTNALTDLCPMILTQQWELWATRKGELCGDPSSVAMEFDGQWANVVKYGTSDHYWGSWGTVTVEYMMFLCLMLFLWGLAMVSELQTVFKWMSVLIYMPSTKGRTQALEVQRRRIRVCAIPPWCRWVGLLSNVLPRLVLYVLASICGIRFLLSVDQLEDLILNCLALVFVITIDDTIYLAFASNLHKSWVNKCRCIQVRCQDSRLGYAWWAAFAHIPGGLTFLPVGALTLYLFFHDYLGLHGKYELANAYRCLCEASGEHCSLALMLGGRTSLPSF